MLRHLLATGARATSRSLVAQANKPSAYVLSVRSLSGEKHKDERKKEGWRQSYEGRSFIKEDSVLLPVFGLSFLASIIAIPIYCKEKKQEAKDRQEPCLTTYDQVPKIGDRHDQSIKKMNPFEIRNVTFGLQPCFTQDHNKNIMLECYVDFELPYQNITSEHKQICDELKQRGIRVEQSEDGARRGLTEYALKYMQKGVEEHVQKKCNCCYSSDDVKEVNCGCDKEKRPDDCITKFKLSPDSKGHAPEHSKTYHPSLYDDDYYARVNAQAMADFSNGNATFELKPIDFRAQFEGNNHLRLTSIVRIGPCRLGIKPCYEEYCEELASRGIHVERSEEGARRGLTQFALQYMQKGVNEHVQKKCRCADQKVCHCG